MNIKEQSIASLFGIHSDILDELKSRQIIRSYNNPVGDYAEFLFCRTFGWKLAAGSEKGFDANDSCHRYQIKGRRITPSNGSRQLSVLRELETGNFDFLAGVLLAKDYSVILAVIIPHSSLVDSKPNFSKHQNGHIFHLDDRIWKVKGICDVTDDVKRFANSI